MNDFTCVSKITIYNYSHQGVCIASLNPKTVIHSEYFSTFKPNLFYTDLLFDI